jgi:hypothetical protein
MACRPSEITTGRLSSQYRAKATLPAGWLTTSDKDSGAAESQRRPARRRVEFGETDPAYQPMESRVMSTRHQAPLMLTCIHQGRNFLPIRSASRSPNGLFRTIASKARNPLQMRICQGKGLVDQYMFDSRDEEKMDSRGGDSGRDCDSDHPCSLATSANGSCIITVPANWWREHQGRQDCETKHCMGLIFVQGRVPSARRLPLVFAVRLCRRRCNPIRFHRLGRQRDGHRQS